jgi:hypothetical protein
MVMVDFSKRLRRHTPSIVVAAILLFILITGIVAASTLDYNSQRKLARTSDGYLHRVSITTDYRVYYERSTDNGASWTGTYLTNGTVDCYDVSIASDSNNYLWVFYGTENGIAYRRWTGAEWGTEVQLTSDRGTVPSIAIDSSDNVHLTWQIDSYIDDDDSNFKSYTRNVTYQTKGVDEDWGTSAFIIDASATTNFTENVTMPTTYTPYNATWTFKVYISETGNTVKLYCLNNSGVKVLFYNNTFGSAGVFMETAILPVVEVWGQSEMAITTSFVTGSDDTYDEYYEGKVAWNFSDVSYKKYASSSWSSAYNLSTNASFYPSLAIDTDDYVHVAWHQYNITSEMNEIKYIKYVSGWGSITNLTSNTSLNYTHPMIACDLSNYVHVVYETSDNNTNYTKYTTSWSSEEIVLNGGNYSYMRPSVSVYDTDDISVQAYIFSGSNYVVKERHNTGSWSSAIELLNVSGKNCTNPSSISAIWPMFCEDCYVNIPDSGYAFTYLEDSTVKYYNASVWQCEDVYTLTVKARDSDNDAIMNFTASLSNGDSQTVTSGTATFNCLEYGYYTVTVSANNYYPTTSSIVLDQSKEEIVFLTSIIDEDYYPPEWRDVTFVVQTVFGEKFADVYVTATPINTTFGSFDWLIKFFGFSEETYDDVQNTTLEGYTDAEGKIVFTMKEEILYQMNFTKAADGIDMSINIYPDDDLFIIYVDSDRPYYRPTVWYDDVNFSISWEEINNTHAYIYFSYNDTLNLTMPLTFYVNNTDANETNVWNFTYNSGCNVSTNSTIVDKTGGKSFYVGFYSTHSTYGSLHKEYTLRFKYFEDTGFPQDAMLIIGMCFIVLFASFFTASTAHIGAIFVSLMGWILYYFQWLSLRSSDALTVTALSLISAIAILSYIAERGRRTQLR